MGAFPQLRLVWLIEAGTHVLCDAVLRPCFRGEAPAARQLHDLWRQRVLRPLQVSKVQLGTTFS